MSRLILLSLISLMSALPAWSVDASYGVDSSDDERPEAAGVGACDLPQTLTIVCP